MEDQLGDITVTSSTRKCSANSGSVRKLKDNAADWFNLLLRWNKLNEDGFTVATDIVNMRRSDSDQELLSHSSSSSSSSSSSRGSAGWSPTELQDSCGRLQDIVEKMAAVLKKMERLVASQRGVARLQEFQCGSEGAAPPLFHSWASCQFEEAAGAMWDGFSQELKLKRTVLQEVAHSAGPDLGLVYLSCWLHQPFLPQQSRRTLEALLLETGHRPL